MSAGSFAVEAAKTSPFRACEQHNKPWPPASRDRPLPSRHSSRTLLSAFSAACPNSQLGRREFGTRRGTARSLGGDVPVSRRGPAAMRRVKSPRRRSATIRWVESRRPGQREQHQPLRGGGVGRRRCVRGRRKLSLPRSGFFRQCQLPQGHPAGRSGPIPIIPEEGAVRASGSHRNGEAPFQFARERPIPAFPKGDRSDHPSAPLHRLAAAPGPASCRTVSGRDTSPHRLPLP